MTAGREADWTPGPAKWAAVLVLGAASIGGLVWSNTSRISRIPDLAANTDEPADTPPAGTGEATHRDTSEAGATPAAAAEKPGVAGILDINTATAAELELLPEIGPALAGRIVEYRKTSGPFRTVEGLTAVRGIGPRTLEKIRAHVTVVPPPTDGSPPPE